MTTAPANPAGGLPKRPATREDLQAAVRAAVDAGQGVQITGSNSMPMVTPPPSKPVQAVSTLRLNRLIDHAVSDMTVTVEAGMALETLQKELAWKNQWLPVDPPALRGRAPGSRTLGGLVATNSLGPLRLGSGDWRSLILAMRWVDARGDLIDGRTDNLSSGDHSASLIGSCGTLGIITELALRTCTRPADEQVLIVFCHTREEAQAVLAALLQAPVTPAYLQAIGGTAFGDNPLELPASAVVVAAGFLDQPTACTAHVELIRRLPLVAKCETIAQTAVQSGRLRLWMTTEPAGVLGLRLVTVSSQVAVLIMRVEALAKSMGGKA